MTTPIAQGTVDVNVGLLGELENDCEHIKDECCEYCGDHAHDSHTCTSGGAHNFRPTGKGYFLVEEGLMTRIKAALR